MASLAPDNRKAVLEQGLTSTTKCFSRNLGNKKSRVCFRVSLEVLHIEL